MHLLSDEDLRSVSMGVQGEIVGCTFFQLQISLSSISPEVCMSPTLCHLFCLHELTLRGICLGPIDSNLENTRVKRWAIINFSVPTLIQEKPRLMGISQICHVSSAGSLEIFLLMMNVEFESYYVWRLTPRQFMGRSAFKPAVKTQRSRSRLARKLEAKLACFFPNLVPTAFSIGGFVGDLAQCTQQDPGSSALHCKSSLSKKSI